MSGFQAGDVVICVDDKPRDHRRIHVRAGRIYRVEKTHPLGGIYVDVDTAAYWSDRFRKLPKADEQFTASIRARKPHQVAA